MTTEPEDDHTVAGCGTKGTSMVDDMTQADRVVAAELFGAYESMTARQRCLDGRLDHHPTTDLVKDHRLASTEALRAELDEAKRQLEIWERTKGPDFAPLTNSALRAQLAEREAEIAGERERAERLGEALRRYGDKVRMAMAPAHLQGDIDEALAKLSEGRS